MEQYPIGCLLKMITDKINQQLSGFGYSSTYPTLRSMI